MPTLLMAQLWKRPVLTALKTPSTAVARPNASSPQQARVAFALTAQVWYLLALTASKTPGGASDLPLSLLPQQARVPFVLIPQLCQPPAVSAVKRCLWAGATDGRHWSPSR